MRQHRQRSATNRYDNRAMAMTENLFDLSEYTKDPILSNSSSATCDVGSFAEMRFCTLAVQKGYEVFLPFCHSTKSDVIVNSIFSRPIRIQIKKATYQKKERNNHADNWKFMIGSGRPSCARNPKDYGIRYRKYEKNEFDILAAYILERDVFVFYELDEICGASSCRWNEQMKFNNWDIFDRFNYD